MLKGSSVPRKSSAEVFVEFPPLTSDVPETSAKELIPEDLLNYKFNLRNDVFFHNIDKSSIERGRKVTVEDQSFLPSIWWCQR